MFSGCKQFVRQKFISQASNFSSFKTVSSCFNSLKMGRKQGSKQHSSKRRSCRIVQEPKTPLKTEMVDIDFEPSKSPLICHLCMCKSEQSLPLFEESSKTLLENIRTIFQIEPIRDESISDKICTHCIGKIDDFIVFRQMVIDNHQKLQLEVEKMQQVVVFEPCIKMEESEDDERVWEDDFEKSDEKKTKRVQKRPTKKFVKKFVQRSNIKSSSAGRDDEYDVLLKKYFTFECSQCDLEFPRFHALRRHTYTEHNQEELSIKCFRSDCDAVFAKRAKLLDHLKKQHDISTFRFYCQICEKGFDQRSIFKAHIEQSSCVPNSNLMLQCHFCSALYRRKGPLKRHFQINHGFEIFSWDTEHKCKDCEKSFASKSCLLNHVQLIHEQKAQEMCDLCAKMFATKWALRLHYKTVHEPKPSATCPVCGKILSTKAILGKHLRRSHQQQPMKCEICSKELRNREALVSHKRRMHAAPRHICPECNKGFASKAKLAEHMITHGIGGDLYSCEWCDKTFNFASSKSLHKKTQHPVEWHQSRDETYRWKAQQQQVSQNMPDSF